MDSPVKKTTIITGYSCNNRCLFCIYSDRHGIPDKSTDLIVKEMFAARKRGNTCLVFVGGEFFIRDDAAFLISKARKLGFSEVVAATNGRMFAYKEFAKKILRSGITQIFFSLHGHTSKVHDSLTQVPGSFNQQIEGIKNVNSLGFKKIGSHTTIVELNYRFMSQIAELLIALNVKSLDFVFVDPNYGGAYNSFSTLVPRISSVEPFAKKCLNFLKKCRTEHFGIRYLPVCRLRGFENYVSDMRDRETVHTEHIAPDFKDFNVEKSRREYKRVKTDKCKPCLYYDSCEGIWKEYFERFGDKELEPIKCKKN